jgi:hypothetical protein
MEGKAYFKVGSYRPILVLTPHLNNEGLWFYLGIGEGKLMPSFLTQQEESRKLFLSLLLLNCLQNNQYAKVARLEAACPESLY